MLAIMLQALAISLVVFAFLAVLAAWFLSGADPCTLLGLSSCPLGLGTGTLGAIALTVLAAWLLFPAVAITVMTSFTDRIAGAVEGLHYPEAAKDARPIGVAQGLALGLKSGGRLLFVIVNGIALGRDVGELAAARHGDRISRRAWLKATRGQQHLIGLVVSVLFLIPFANLVAPVIGTAAGIHLFNRSFWKMNPGRVVNRHSPPPPM